MVCTGVEGLGKELGNSVKINITRLTSNILRGDFKTQLPVDKQFSQVVGSHYYLEK